MLMEKSIRLMNLSPIIRNYSFLPNYERITHKFWQKSIRHYQDATSLKEPNTLKDITKSINSNASIKDKTKLIHEFLHNNDTDKTLSVTSTVLHLNSLAKSYIITDDHEKATIRNSKEFQALCSKIQKDIRCLSIDEILTCLKIMNILKVPSNTMIVQTLLQYIRVSVNELSLNQIIYTWHLICVRRHIPLVIALQKALCVVYKNEIVTLDITSMAQLKLALQFSCMIMDQDSINVIGKALLKYPEKYSVQDAIAIYKYLSLMEPSILPKSVIQLLSRLYYTMNLSIENITFSNATMLLRTMCHAVQQNMMYFYNQTLVDLIVQNLLKTEQSFSHVNRILNYLNQMHYSSKPVLDYMMKICGHNMLTFRTCSPLNKLVVIKGFNISNYKPDIWPAIKKELTLENMVELDTSQLLSLALNLAILEHYDPNILEKIFSINIKSLHKRSKYADAFKLLSMHQNVKVFYPAYTGPFLSEDTLVEISSMVNNCDKDKHLTKMLQFVLGDNSYVRENVRTRLGHLIDQIVVTQPNGEPLNINDLIHEKEDRETVFTEDIKPPNGSQVLLIFNMPKYAYSINTKRLLSPWMLILKTAEALTGFRAVAIDTFIFKHLNERAKIAYLKNIVKMKDEFC